MIGLALGLALAALLEILNTSMRSAGDVLEILKLPVIAQVPFVAADADCRRARRQRLLGGSVASVAVCAAAYGFWTLRLWEHIV
jgi:hypothetical protein